MTEQINWGGDSTVRFVDPRFRRPWRIGSTLPNGRAFHDEGESLDEFSASETRPGGRHREEWYCGRVSKDSMRR